MKFRGLSKLSMERLPKDMDTTSNMQKKPVQLELKVMLKEKQDLTLKAMSSLAKGEDNRRNQKKSMKQRRHLFLMATTWRSLEEETIYTMDG